MFPIGDDDTSRRTVPLVTYALVALNVLLFFVEQSGGDAFIEKWAFVPTRFLANPFGDLLTLFTSMFMHAGWVHLGGNMLYLWIFGDNVEDRFGHVKFAIFYLVCGLAATFALLAFVPTREGRMQWAWIPAIVLALMGVIFGAFSGALMAYLLPVILIVGGGILIFRTLTNK